MSLTKATFSMIEGALVNVLDFGADPTGATDSSVAFQAAVNANLGKQIRIPAGSYLFNSTVEMDVTGLGSRVSVCQFYGDGMTRTVINNQAGGAAFLVTGGSGNDFAFNFVLKDLTIDSVGSNAGTIGVELDSCIFATIDNVRILNMASHGVKAFSSFGDSSSTATTQISHCQIEFCGGFGVFGETDGNSVQSGMNMYQCRINQNQLGGALFESTDQTEISYTVFALNQNFGIRFTEGSGVGPSAPKLNHIDHCEFDNNNGVQIDLIRANTILITAPLLIAGVVSGFAFTKGILVGALCRGIVIEQAFPRFDPSLTGLTVMEFVNGAQDIVARDTSYSGFSGSNGQMYVDNTAGQVTIDDRFNRLDFETGEFTVEVKDQSGNTSPTTKTGYYTFNSNLVTVSFRNLNDIDTSGLVSGEAIFLTLPFSCRIDDVGFIGSCVITTDSGSADVPFPFVASGGNLASFRRAGTNATLTAGNLTSGTSDIAAFTLSYQK